MQLSTVQIFTNFSLYWNWSSIQFLISNPDQIELFMYIIGILYCNQLVCKLGELKEFGGSAQFKEQPLEQLLGIDCFTVWMFHGGIILSVPLEEDRLGWGLWWDWGSSIYLLFIAAYWSRQPRVFQRLSRSCLECVACMLCLLPTLFTHYACRYTVELGLSTNDLTRITLDNNITQPICIFVCGESAVCIKNCPPKLMQPSSSTLATIVSAENQNDWTIVKAIFFFCHYYIVWEPNNAGEARRQF